MRSAVLATDKILAILADGQFHSGEELGDALGISRAAVWKQLQKLDSLKLDIESQKGRGYRIAGGLDLLDKQRMVDLASDDLLPFIAQLDVAAVLESTNEQAARQIAKGGAHGYCCTAEQQTAGRGRRGRTWLSPFGRSLYFSMVWQFNNGAAALEGLSLCVGVAIARGLARAGVDGIALKWPNDILRDGRKLAGILLEMQGDPAGICQVIIGVGINVRLLAVDTSSITQPWADLSDLAISKDRNQLLVVVLEELVLALNEYTAKGFAAFRHEWQSLDAYSEREVLIQLGDDWIAGVAEGVDATGGLRLRTDQGVRSFHGGEISLRSRS